MSIVPCFTVSRTLEADGRDVLLRFSVPPLRRVLFMSREAQFVHAFYSFMQYIRRDSLAWLRLGKTGTRALRPALPHFYHNIA